MPCIGQHNKKQRHHFANKGPYTQSYNFSSSHVWMWELDHKEDWALKNWCFQIVVLEETLESLSDCKEIKPVNPKGNQLWVFIGRIDAETPILWPPDAKSRLIGKALCCSSWGLTVTHDLATKEQQISYYTLARSIYLHLLGKMNNIYRQFAPMVYKIPSYFLQLFNHSFRSILITQDSVLK